VTEDSPSPAGRFMAAEIAEQPAVLARQFASQRAEIQEVADFLRNGNHRFVLLAARGTSDHAALYAKYLIETKLGLPVGLASPSTLTAYGSTLDFQHVLWVAVSQSGSSPDLIESTQRASAAGATTLAVTNAPNSPLRAASDLHIDIAGGQETSVAATKTYTAQLQALWLLISAWRGADLGPAEAIPEAVQELLHLPQVEQLADRYRSTDRLVTVGRGFSYPTAREAALKLMETTYLSAQAFSGADLMHGPFAMIEEGAPVIVIAPEGIGGSLLRPVVERLLERNADMCIVGNTRLTEPNKSVAAIPQPPGLDESLSPIVQIVPLQQLALKMALTRHLDPDQPRGLRKVTETH
jgi:glucosamine--fructose-6-phosphate aminotransferase (isomerizing)